MFRLPRENVKSQTVSIMGIRGVERNLIYIYAQRSIVVDEFWAKSCVKHDSKYRDFNDFR